MKTICMYSVVCLMTGCAQSQYFAGELPGKFAARPIRDYSTVDLTPYAISTVDQNTIQPGDRLQVNLNPGTLQQDSELVWKVSIDESGETTLPNIGPVKLAGLTRAEAKQTIEQVSLQRDVFLTPVVDVSIADRTQRTILVSGAVLKPGPVKITGKNITLADALVRAGGITSGASGNISVSGASDSSDEIPGMENAIRPVGQASREVRAVTVSLESTPPARLGDILVPDGSVVHVEPTPARPIQVVGVIRDQAVEVPSGQNVRLLDALTLAGGQTYSNWISDKVTVIRRVPDRNETIRIRASIRDAKNDDKENILLAPYDIVSVEENVLTFTLSTLSGLFGAGVSAAQIGRL